MVELAKSNVKGALLALLAFGIFATHDVIVKFLGGSYSPFQIVFFSVTFGFPIVTIMLMNDRSEGNLLPRHPWWTALRTGAAVVTGASAFYAFSVLPLTQTYAILFATPLLITLLAIPILGEKVRFRRGAAVVVGLIGVMVVLRPGSEPLSLGHLAGLTAAVGGSFVSIIVRKIGQDERAVVLLLYPMVANFVVMGAALPFVYQPMPVSHLGALAVMALFGFIGSLLVIASYRAAEAVIVAPDAVFADPLGHGLRLFPVRRKTRSDHGCRHRDHHGVRRLHRAARGAARCVRKPAGAARPFGRRGRHRAPRRRCWKSCTRRRARRAGL